jgi:hypothetical protein
VRSELFELGSNKFMGDPCCKQGYIGIRSFMSRTHTLINIPGLRWPDSVPSSSEMYPVAFWSSCLLIDCIKSRYVRHYDILVGSMI